MKNKYIYLTFLILAVLLFLLYQQVQPILLSLFTHFDDQQMQHDIKALGNYGHYTIFLLQFLQAYLFIIPAFPLQILAGYAYHLIDATLFILCSYFLANILLFYSFQYQNRLFDKLSKRFRNKPLFWLYALPIAPTFIKPYIARQNQLSFPTFFKTLFASIPTILLAIVIGTCLRHSYDSYALLFAGIYALITITSSLFLYRDMKR